MKFARVMGTVVATVKDRTFSGKKLLILQPLDGRGQPLGSPIIGMDSVGAGAGETVLYVGGKEASFPFSPEEVPVDAGIVAIVDFIDRAWEFPAEDSTAEESKKNLPERFSDQGAGRTEGPAPKQEERLPPPLTQSSPQKFAEKQPQPVPQTEQEAIPSNSEPEPKKRGKLFRRRKRSKRKRS